MSADNWAVCPRCEIGRQARIAEAEDEVAAAYGKVAIERWDEMRAAAEALKAAPAQYTFREDYEFWGAEEGELNISYSGGCRECGLKHSFRYSEPMAVTP